MEIRGKIIVKLPLQSGTSKAGNPWSKQEYVLETVEAYPKKVHFDFFGERANQYPLEVGDLIDLSFDIDSHEYNGRWFTSLIRTLLQPSRSSLSISLLPLLLALRPQVLRRHQPPQLLPTSASPPRATTCRSRSN